MNGDRLANGSKRTAKVKDSEATSSRTSTSSPGSSVRRSSTTATAASPLAATTEEPWALKTAESTQDGITKIAHIVQAKTMRTLYRHGRRRVAAHRRGARP